jgi:3-dehydroquinate synthase
LNLNLLPVKLEISFGLEALYERVKNNSNIVFLVDENTQEHCLPKLQLPFVAKVICIKSGEIHKTLATIEFIWSELLKLNANRKTVLINLGGGVLTDLGGFAASTYQRGIAFINIPTTLMGMVDAANGGKTGFNFGGFKNYIGTFCKPEQLIIYPDFLETLPFKHLRSGYAEMLKHGLIADKEYFFDTYINLNLSGLNKDLSGWIERSIEIKSEIINLDFKESGLRKLLNFGHTIGHAIESELQPLLHGDCIAAGMICEAWLSYNNGLLSFDNFNTIITIIDSSFKRIGLSDAVCEAIISNCMRDKKNHSDKILCVQLEAIGKAVYDIEVSQSQIEQSLAFYRGI